MIQPDLAQTLLVCGDENRRNFEEGAEVWNEDQLRRYGRHAAMMLDAYAHQLGELIKVANSYERDRRRFAGLGTMAVSHFALRVPSNDHNG